MTHKTLPVTTESEAQFQGRGYPVSNARLAILILLGSELMLFAGLIGTFLVFRLGSVIWPPPSHINIRLPRAVTGINTVFLLLSGYTMFQALRAVRKNGQRELRNWLLVTGILGSIFLVVQGSEWFRLVHLGFTLSSGVYGSIFYILIGCHALHVVGAVLWLLTVLVIASMGRFSANHHIGVELCAIYWVFVVVLWPILYVLVYLV
ncbi:heme-copper oxidase subunit III [Candidatus Poribacteria bacterium]|nr:heme-copper oxidase subunit III [Candidatus Poribacteria bacterium]